MKKILLVICLILVSCTDQYKTFKPKEIEIKNLLNAINPSDNYDYLEINYSNGISLKTLFFKGNKELKLNSNYKESTLGFFLGCQPLYCCYNIIYLKNGKWNYVLNEAELATFIGKIDNPQEAFLIAKINEYNIDSDNEKGNGYLKTKNGYNLKVMKYKPCPESKESFIVSIDSTGKLRKTESQGFYLKTKECIVY